MEFIPQGSRPIATAVEMFKAARICLLPSPVDNHLAFSQLETALEYRENEIQ